MKLIRIKSLRYLDGLRVYVTFTDGTSGVADYEGHLEGFLSPVDNVETFSQAYLEHGTLTWPGGYDVAVEHTYALVHGLTPPETTKEVERNFALAKGRPTMDVLFNRRPLVQAGSIAQPSMQDLKSTFGLWNASLDDAIRFGGDVTREAIQAMNLRHDRKNIIVDTKVHMLMPGWSPAILGWHTDGAPRDATKNPQGKGEPDTFAQEGDDRFNRYHILVTGTGCLTQYINKPLIVPIPSKPSTTVYSEMSKYVQDHVRSHPEDVSTFPTCTVMEFDWWDIHTGVVATQAEWRFLIRVCESDYYEPRRDLREVIRLQSQVYSPVDFGW